MEKEQQNKHNKAEKEGEKFSKLSSALKKNLVRRKLLKKKSISDAIPEQAGIQKIKE